MRDPGHMEGMAEQEPASTRGAEELKAEEPKNPRQPRRQRTYRGLDSFEVWNELKSPVFIMDFAPGRSRYLWASDTYLDLYNSTFEDWVATDLGQISQGVRQIFDNMYLKVQQRGETVQDTKTVYPQGRAMTLETEVKPISILLDGAKEPRNFALVECAPVDRFDQSRINAARSHELLQYNDVPSMMFSKSGELLFANICATNHYHQAEYSHSAYVEGRDIKLEDVIESMVWESEVAKAQLLKEVKALCLTDTCIEIESKKKGTGKSLMHHKNMGDDWFRVRFLPIQDPLTTDLAIMVTEYEISDLKSSQVELLEAQAVRDKFVSATSHELRTPLNGIIGLAESLAFQPNSSTALESLSAIKDCGHRLSTLVNEMLDAAACKSGTLVIKNENVDIHQVAAEACGFFAKRLEPGVRLINNIQPSLPKIRGDRTRIHKIFTNLLSNAVKFTHQGLIELSANTYMEKYLQVDLVDTGIGIPSESVGTIWEQFSQVDMTCTRRYGGTGLGLSVARDLVEAHGGCIKVASSTDCKDRGSTFTFILPINPESDKPFQKADADMPPSQKVRSDLTAWSHRRQSTTELSLISDRPDAEMTLMEECKLNHLSNILGGHSVSPSSTATSSPRKSELSKGRNRSCVQGALKLQELQGMFRRAQSKGRTSPTNGRESPSSGRCSPSSGRRSPSSGRQTHSSYNGDTAAHVMVKDKISSDFHYTPTPTSRTASDESCSVLDDPNRASSSDTSWCQPDDSGSSPPPQHFLEERTTHLMRDVIY